MAVIAGGRTQEFHLFLLSPGSDTVLQSMVPGKIQHLIHHRQAGASADEGLVLPAAQNLRPVSPGRRQSKQLAVVSGVDALVHTEVAVRQRGQNVTHLIQLLSGGLAPRHIQRQLRPEESIIALPLRRKRRFQLCLIHTVICHITPSLFHILFRIIRLFPENANTFPRQAPRNGDSFRFSFPFTKNPREQRRNCPIYSLEFCLFL